MIRRKNLILIETLAEAGVMPIGWQENDKTKLLQ